MDASRIRVLFLSALLQCAAPAAAQQATDLIAPEPGAEAIRSTEPSGGPVRAEEWMVAAAHPLAAEAGADVLRAGGSAADAAMAIQLVLGLVEPQSSGLGGGAFLLFWDAAAGRLTTLDGRETAPRAARPTLFLDEAGEPLDFFDAVIGGRSVGVPGTPMLLADMHRRWGRLPWPDLFAAAIRLADEGFAVTPRLSALIKANADSLSSFEATRRLFLPGGSPPLPGSTFRNPAFADTLRLLAREGVRPFYRGEIARDIVATVRSAPGNPGLLGLADMAAFEVVERAPVCVVYRRLDVCGMGPPSSGGIAVGQILGVLAHFDMAALGREAVESWQLFADATRLAFADRSRYLADSDYVPVPVKGLLAPDYLAERAALLAPGERLEEAEPGSPEWDHALELGDGEALELPSTSHFVVVDADGNVASMTTTIENAFGSRLAVRGFLLNNELTDFSFRTHADGRPVANQVEPGKRPRSSMAPNIVLEAGRPVLALGSPGGARIIPYVAKTLVAIIDWGMDVQSAVAFPHAVNLFGTFELEAGTAAADLAPVLEAMGYETEVRDHDSGLHAIVIEDGALYGAADPRREGMAVGQ
ncbi:MAG TPA: gamma-glutamyltransferase [Afifellaceae bacterium]|nr:gamma-glutamyltransferase [Afifellaceae bacterium]